MAAASSKLVFVLAAVSACAHSAVVDGVWTAERAQAGWRITLRRPTEIINPVREIILPAFDAASPPVEIRRGAGVFHLTGTLAADRGQGEFRFIEDREFVSALREIGADWWNPDRLYELAVRGVTLEAVRRAPEVAYPIGPRLPSARFAQMDAAAVEYWRSLRESGYLLTPGDLRRLRTYNVAPDLLRQMKISGYDALSVTDMQRLQSHGVTSFDIQLFEARGFRNLSTDDIVRLKNNGIPDK
jgi:hypothetical protein